MTTLQEDFWNTDEIDWRLIPADLKYKIDNVLSTLDKGYVKRDFRHRQGRNFERKRIHLLWKEAKINFKNMVWTDALDLFEKEAFEKNPWRR